MLAPRVSVVVPNYNHAQFLAQRLDSILAQTFDDFEIIVLDDASSDGSLQLLKTYENYQRMQFHQNDKNSGNPFKQWNKGMALARGEYVWIAESDDYADSHLLQELVETLDKYPAAGLAYCQSWVVGREGGSSDRKLLEAPYIAFDGGGRWKEDFINSGVLELRNFLVYKNTIPNASAVLFRRTLVSDGLKAPEEMRLAGDWMFWARILARCDIAYLAKPLNYFRAPHQASQREKTKRQGLDLLEGLEVYAFIEGCVHLPDEIKKRALLQQVKLWGSLAFLRLLSPATNRSIYRKILSVHPEVTSSPGWSVLAPFMLYLITAPVRRLPLAVSAYKWFKRRTHFLLGNKLAN